MTDVSHLSQNRVRFAASAWMPYLDAPATRSIQGPSAPAFRDENPMRFLHVADIHLDSPMRHLRRMHEGAPGALAECTRRALENLVAFALEPASAIDFVVIAGDVFDGTWKDYQTGLFLQSQLLRLKSAGIPVVAIRGNHDAQGKMIRDLADWRDSITFLDADRCQTLRGSEIGLTDDVIFHGQSFRDASVTENLAAGYPIGSRGAFHLGLLHTSLAGNFDGHENYAPCTLDDLRSRNYGYWALGHIHIRQPMHRDGDAAPVHFAGNLQGRNVRECGPKGALVVDVDDDFRATCRFEAFDVLRWQHLVVELETGDDLADAMTRLEASLKTAVAQRERRDLAVRVTFVGRCKAHRKFSKDPEGCRAEVHNLAADAAQDVVWLEKIRFRTQSTYDRARLAADDGPAGELIRLLDDAAEGRSELESLDCIDDLLRKLPAELKSSGSVDSDEPAFLSPEHLRRLLPRAEALLLDAMHDADD